MKATGLFRSIRDYSVIGKSLLEVYIPLCNLEKVNEKCDKLNILPLGIESIRPWEFDKSLEGEYLEKIKLATCRRLAFLYYHAPFINLKRTILDGYDEGTKARVLELVEILKKGQRLNVEINPIESNENINPNLIPIEKESIKLSFADNIPNLDDPPVSMGQEKEGEEEMECDSDENNSTLVKKLRQDPTGSGSPNIYV